jgi:group I intron endonuclease
MLEQVFCINIYMIIYRLLSPSGKCYIGQTQFNIERRITGHLGYWKRGVYKCPKLYRAFDKYGPVDVKQLCVETRIDFKETLVSWRSGNWVIQIICECFSKEELDEKEKYFIKYYNSIDNGYNICRGGEGGNAGRVFGKETRRKISEYVKAHPQRYWLGKCHSEETRRKISNSKKGIPLSEEHKKKLRNFLIGRPVSEETKIKISKSNLGKKRSPEMKLKNSLSHKGIRPSTFWKPGNVPWNKGKVGLQKAWNKGKTGIYSEETRRKMGRKK